MKWQISVTISVTSLATEGLKAVKAIEGKAKVVTNAFAQASRNYTAEGCLSKGIASGAPAVNVEVGVDTIEEMLEVLALVKASNACELYSVKSATVKGAKAAANKAMK